MSCLGFVCYYFYIMYSYHYIIYIYIIFNSHYTLIAKWGWNIFFWFDLADLHLLLIKKSLPIQTRLLPQWQKFQNKWEKSGCFNRTTCFNENLVTYPATTKISWTFSEAGRFIKLCEVFDFTLVFEASYVLEPVSSFSFSKCQLNALLQTTEPQSNHFSKSAALPESVMQLHL